MIYSVFYEAHSEFSVPLNDVFNTGLGNILFIYFTCWSLSKKYNHTFNNNHFIEYLKRIHRHQLTNHKNTIYRNMLSYFTSEQGNAAITPLFEPPGRHECFHQNVVENIRNNPNGVYVMRGYWQSYKYFHEYRDEIVDMISPDKDSNDIILKKYPNLRPVGTDTDVRYCNHVNVSIHMRLSYETLFENGSSLCYDISYYNDAAQIIRAKVGTEATIYWNVFSDNMKECKQKMNDGFVVKTNEHVVYHTQNSDYIDFWSMSLCHHNILSHSTLCWWSAYINLNQEKIVLYPTDMLRIVCNRFYPEPVLLERLDDYFPPGWVGVNTRDAIYLSK